MDHMIENMLSWWKDIDLIDMTLQKWTEPHDEHSYGYSSDDDKVTDAENKLRDYFMSQITDAT